MEIQGTTRVFALLGDPVGHSLSPLMYNAAFRVLGLDAIYVPLRCSPDAVEPLMESLARQGGGGNVTIPHKARAAVALARLGGPTLEVCNTFWSDGRGISGAETDSQGILAALRDLVGSAPNGNWLLIGTGGSARAAIGAAKRAGASVAFRSRDPERAKALGRVAETQEVGQVDPRECAVVINCTPLGLASSDPLPLDPHDVPPDGIVLDLVYRPGETVWVRELRKRGCRAADGRWVLVEQGAAAFEQWFPNLSAPREVMRAAVRAALE